MGEIGVLISVIHGEQRLQNGGSDRLLLQASGVSTYSGP
jgi:hypothetical protein